MSRTNKSIFMAASASLLLCAMPAWAGHGRHFGKGSHHHKGSNLIQSPIQGAGGGQGTSSVTGTDDSGTDADADTHPGSNEGGAVRELERANQVAGEQGQWGRTNAGGQGRR
jgi:hypothetical protein